MKQLHFAKKKDHEKVGFQRSTLFWASQWPLKLLNLELRLVAPCIEHWHNKIFYSTGSAVLIRKKVKPFKALIFKIELNKKIKISLISMHLLQILSFLKGSTFWCINYGRHEPWESILHKSGWNVNELFDTNNCTLQGYNFSSFT